MNIAVTGASGFIGRHVVAELERRGLHPVLVSRTPASEAGASVALDLAIADEDAFAKMGSPDLVIHLAWSGLPNYRSLHHMESELPAQYRFLSGLVRSGLKHLVVAGTCFEYGMASGPLSEDMPAHPTNPYGFAKDTLRTQLAFLQKATPFSLTWGRLFYLYGEAQAATSLFPQLRAAVRAGEKTFKMSRGDQLRDFLPVEEAVRLLVALALRGANDGIVNICSGKPTSVRALVEKWLVDNQWNIDLELGYYPYPDYEPMAFWGDRKKLDSILQAV